MVAKIAIRFTFAPKQIMLTLIHHRKLQLSLILLFFSFALGAQIVNIEDKRSLRTDSTGFLGNIDLGFNFTQNGSKIVTWQAASQMEKAWEKSLLLFLGNFQRITINDDNFINQWSTHLRFNRNLTDRLVYEAFLQGQFDERLRIGFRSLAGTGLRLELLNEESDQKLFLGASYMFEYDEILDSTLTFQDHRLNSYFSFNLKPLDNLIISGTTYFQPIIGWLAEYRLSSNNNVVIKITEKFSLRTSFSITYDTRLSRVLPDVPSTTYSFINAIRWEFGG